MLAKEVIDYLAIEPEGVYLDATLGDGGHAYLICQRLSAKGRLIGIDQDGDALSRTKENLCNYLDRVIMVKGNFRDIFELMMDIGVCHVDGILMDLGVSSYQVETAERGFSFHQEGPLDMRMDRSIPGSASEIVNRYSQKELSRIFRMYGEEKWSQRIASFIVKNRNKKAITTTRELVNIIKDAIPASTRRVGGHPARKVFQALRMEVNQELKSLQEALYGGADLLSLNGRFCVISYHSLEDRPVKHFFKERSRCSCPPQLPVCRCFPDFDVLTSRPVYPAKDEVELNPRSRSARMRVARKTSVLKERAGE